MGSFLRVGIIDWLYKCKLLLSTKSGFYKIGFQNPNENKVGFQNNNEVVFLKIKERKKSLERVEMFWKPRRCRNVLALGLDDVLSGLDMHHLYALYDLHKQYFSSQSSSARKFCILNFITGNYINSMADN